MSSKNIQSDNTVASSTPDRDKTTRPVQRVDYILSQCEGKRVLHLGCTNWPYTLDSIAQGSLLHAAIEKRAKETYGIDGDKSGLGVMKDQGFTNLYYGDLEQLEESELQEKFDVVVAGEIIEHLNNPGLFLKGVKRFLKPDSTLLITTINAYCALRYAVYALRGKRGTVEPVHPDHVAYYSYSTLRLLLQRHGFDISELLFYDLGPEHSVHLRKVVGMFNDISVRFFPQFSDGLIARCRVAHSESGEIQT